MTDRIAELETGKAFDKAKIAELKLTIAELQRELKAIRANQTVTVEYDLSPAMTESALRDKLIELGWTPPNN